MQDQPRTRLGRAGRARALLVTTVLLLVAASATWMLTQSHRPDTTDTTTSPTSTPATPDTTDAATAARNFLTLWARPQLSYDEWWAALKPLMNGQGQQDYAYTDPAGVPALKIHGAGQVDKAQVDTSAVVWFSTDQGRFGVRLSRTSGTAPWLVARLYFPGTKPDLPTGPTDTSAPAVVL